MDEVGFSPPRKMDSSFRQLSLSQQLGIFNSTFSMSDEAYTKRQRLIAELASILSTELDTHVILRTFGSFEFGLSDDDSDLDMVMEVPIYHFFDQVQEDRLFLNVVRVLKKLTNWCTNVNAIVLANLYLFRFEQSSFNIKCDLTLRNFLGVKKAELIKFYMHSSPELATLIRFIKYWAKFHGFCSAKKIKSYCFNLMVIFYWGRQQLVPSMVELQGKLEPLTDPEDNIEGCDTRLPKTEPITSSVFEIKDAKLFRNHLTGFFEFYSKFDYKNQVICFNTFEIVEKKQFQLATPNKKTVEGHPTPTAVNLHKEYLEMLIRRKATEVLPLNTSKPFVVQDPFLLNVCFYANGNELHQFIQACNHSLEILERENARFFIMDLFVDMSTVNLLQNTIKPESKASRKKKNKQKDKDLTKTNSFFQVPEKCTFGPSPSAPNVTKPESVTNICGRKREPTEKDDTKLNPLFPIPKKYTFDAISIIQEVSTNLNVTYLNDEDDPPSAPNCGLKFGMQSPFVRTFAQATLHLKLQRKLGSFVLLQKLKSLWLDFVSDYFLSEFSKLFNNAQVEMINGMRSHNLPGEEEEKRRKANLEQIGYPQIALTYGKKKDSIKTDMLPKGFIPSLFVKKVGQIEQVESGVISMMLRFTNTTANLVDPGIVKEAFRKVFPAKKYQSEHEHILSEYTAQVCEKDNYSAGDMEFTIYLKLDHSELSKSPVLYVAFQQTNGSAQKFDATLEIGIIGVITAQTLPDYILSRLVSWMEDSKTESIGKEFKTT